MQKCIFKRTPLLSGLEAFFCSTFNPRHCLRDNSRNCENTIDCLCWLKSCITFYAQVTRAGFYRCLGVTPFVFVRKT